MELNTKSKMNKSRSNKKRQKKSGSNDHRKNKVLYLPPQKRDESFYFSGSQK
jgi:hypothetical protein